MSRPKLPSVLVIDDEVRSLEALRRTLEEDFEVFTAADAEAATTILEREAPVGGVQIILCDQRMPGTTGVEFLRGVRDRWPDSVRIILSGYTESEDIIAGINEAGIYQYLLKPWQPEQLLVTLRNAHNVWRLQQENQRLSVELRAAEPVLKKRVEMKYERVKREFGLDGLIRAPGSPLDTVCTLIGKVAPFDLSVLISGESGTGKEMVARAIHYCSRRADKAFVVENCGALPDQLLEAELFGYKRGAFTDARSDRQGMFVEADGGTLFLDEIGDLSPALQAKLLRVLAEREIRPLGAARPEKIDVRVISATHQDLLAGMRAGTFREDLYYRLNVLQIHLPALRDRAEDLLPLCEHFLGRAAQHAGKSISSISQPALKILLSHSWPGNVRELENVIERAVALCDSTQIVPQDLPQTLRERRPTDLIGYALQRNMSLQELEREYILRVMKEESGNKTRAAQRLGLDRKTLYRKLEETEQRSDSSPDRERVTERDADSGHDSRPDPRSDSRPDAKYDDDEPV